MDISYSGKSVTFNVSDGIVKAFWYWLGSVEPCLLFTSYSDYILQVR